ncbi:MAG: hypothetical protein AAF770_03475 [Bacteroidota bacterium]
MHQSHIKAFLAWTIRGVQYSCQARAYHKHTSKNNRSEEHTKNHSKLLVAKSLLNKKDIVIYRISSILLFMLTLVFIILRVQATNN